MDIDEMIALLQQRKEERGRVDVSTLEYTGGGDAVCDVVNLVFDEETKTLRVVTVHR
jgi:hypothetical protein